MCMPLSCTVSTLVRKKILCSHNSLCRHKSKHRNRDQLSLREWDKKMTIGNPWGSFPSWGDNLDSLGITLGRDCYCLTHFPNPSALGKEFIFRIIIGKCLNTYFQVAFHWPLTLVHMELALSWLKDMPFRRGGWTLWVRLKEGGKYGHFCAYLRLYSLETALEEFMLALNVAFLCLFCFLALADVHQHQRKNLSRTWCRGSYLNPDT